jgi:hypothetical protein
MWIPWAKAEAETARDALQAIDLKHLADKIQDQLTFAADTETQATLREAVMRKYVSFSDGDIDIDDAVAISESDYGAYVSAWLWLDNEEMGIETAEEDVQEETD